MWTAAAGASVQSQNLDVIANNLANADTPSFKKDTPTFKEYLANVEREHEGLDIPRGPIKDKDFYPLDGRDQAFVVMDGTHTSFRQGPLHPTQNQFDVAIDGSGFLEISTPGGIRYTRVGAMKMDQTGRLVTSEGYPILAAQPLGLTPAGQGPNQNDVAARYINLRDKGPRFSINEQGEIYTEDSLIAKLSVIDFPDLRKIQKIGAQNFVNTDLKNQPFPAKAVIRQGALESSNVNPIEEMSNLIRAHRLFEHDLKSLKTYGDLLGKEANEVGKL